MNLIKTLFSHDPRIAYLNHGSFGACPSPIFENALAWQRALEYEAVQFITKKGVAALKNAKDALGKYVGCAADDLIFVQNPTWAINQVVKSLKLQAGDEVLTTDHEYGAMDKTFSFYSKKMGFSYVRQPISLPLLSKEQFLEEFWKGYSEKTRVVFISQMTSTTALVFPAKEICERAKELGLITIVDGAHVPGHIPLNLAEIKADYYTGTLHKWLLAPKGSSFLYVNKACQDSLDPLVISWGYESPIPEHRSKFLEENEVQGTRDISAFLCTPSIFQFWEDNDWAAKCEASKQVILENYERFGNLLNTKPLCALSSDFLGQMCSIPIQTTRHDDLKECLYHDYGIEIPIMRRGNDTYIRISYQAYNTLDDLDRLEQALKEIVAKGELLVI